MNRKDRPPYTKPYDVTNHGTAKGWDKLVIPLIEEVNNYNSDKVDDDKITIDCIKEKFAGLRFYVSKHPHDLFEKIRNAEQQSYNTCEYCGYDKDMDKVGRAVLGPGTWFKTLCKKCAETAERECKSWTSNTELREQRKNNPFIL